MKKFMKKMSAILIALLMLLPVFAVGASADAGEKIAATEGWGDADGDSVFEVSCAGDLIAMANKRTANGNYAGKIIRLTADIDLNPGWDASSKTVPTNVWTAMFRFDGTIDGQGHTIRGLYCSAASNASFIVNLTGGTIKNIKFENSYFKATGKVAGLIACIKHDSTIENVYVNTISESATGGAGGIVATMGTTGNETPKLTIRNCVFNGSVTSVHFAAGILGTNDKFEAIIEDCANYGTITTSTDTYEVGAGIIGRAHSKATLKRCYNGGVVSSGTGVINVIQQTPATIVVEDTYFSDATCTKGFYKQTAATDCTIRYKNVVAEDLVACSMTDLIKKDEFKANGAYKGWAIDPDLAIAVPAPLLSGPVEHQYVPTVTAPTCAEKGYTTYVCSVCGDTYVGDYVDTIEHTPSEEWIVDKEADETFAGSRHKECTVCGKTVKTEVIPKKGSTATTAASTTAAPAENNATTTTTAAEGGCGGSIATVGMLALFMTSLCALAISRKRRTNV